jgi:hypothetical protein
VLLVLVVLVVLVSPLTSVTELAATETGPISSMVEPEELVCTPVTVLMIWVEVPEIALPSASVAETLTVQCRSIPWCHYRRCRPSSCHTSRRCLCSV